jgi:hypothetical protein
VIIAEMASEAPERPQKVRKVRPAVPAPERVKTFSVASLKGAAKIVLGVPPQVLTGAQSAGFLPRDDEVVTMDEARAAVDRYMKQEVRSS